MLFWSGVLRWQLSEPDHGGADLLPNDDTGFRLRFLPSEDEKGGPDLMHIDLTSSSPDEQQQIVARSLSLGARHLDVGQLPEEGHVVLADPEDNEFCVLAPG